MSVILGNFVGLSKAGTAIQAGYITGGSLGILDTMDGQAAIGGTIAGAIATPSINALASVPSCGPLRGFADEFYFRIWVLPLILDAQNPTINSPIPFKIWNSYLTANTITSIDELGTYGLTLDLNGPNTLSKLEQRTLSVVIGELAPYTIDASYQFNFTFGGGTLRFLAQLADILPIVANVGVVERFEWLTDILPHYDGTEQRIALRGRPRRSFEMNYTIHDEADRKALYDKIYKTLGRTVITPSYQYQSVLKRNTVIGDNKLYCNPLAADLRAGENVVLTAPKGLFYFYRVDAVFADHVTITTAFSQIIPKLRTKVSGGFAARLPDSSGLTMNANGGQSTLVLMLPDSRSQIAIPDYPVTIPTLSGLPYLDRRPLADGEAAELFDAGLEIIDNETGIPAQFSAWDQKYVSGSRKYLINGLFDKDEMQYWRTFLDYCRGRQRLFYTPTWRADLVHVVGTPVLANEIEVIGNDYPAQYLGSPTYSHLRIETSEGVFLVKVSDAQSNGGTSTIRFTSPLFGDLTGITVSRISYVMLCRLGLDTVTLTHDNTHSVLELTLRAVKQ